MITTQTTTVAAVPSYEGMSIFDLLREQAGESTREEKTAYVNSYVSARNCDKNVYIRCRHLNNRSKLPFIVGNLRI